MDLDPLRHVKFFAAVKHGEQKYSNGLPYTHHLAAVEQVARRFFGSEWDVLYGFSALEVYEACWLHDSLEDVKGLKAKDIEEMFGPNVTKLVVAVTNEPGPNRKARHAFTYPKIRAAGPAAVYLKLCDRIANVEAGGKLVDMYREEHDGFRRNLHTPGENEVLWAHINGLLK